MNRTSFPARLSMAAPLVLLVMLLYPAPSRAQYLYIDTNGDGVHTDADTVNPGGPTNLDIWLDTQHDRDGSLQTCNSHTGAPHPWDGSPPDPGLDFFSYDIFLIATHGAMIWGTFEDHTGFESLSDDVSSDTQIHVTRFARLGDEKPAGLYKLGSISVSVGAGTPSISFGLMTGWDFNAFGTHCSATDQFPNSYVLGIDFLDADGVLYGGPTNHEPTLGWPEPIRVIENRVMDQALTAQDEDGQALSFSKLSGPDYVTVSTRDPGSGQGSGSIHVAPRSSDVGSARAIVRVSDGIFWCDRPVEIQVAREFQLSPLADVSMTSDSQANQALSVDNPLQQALTYYVVSGPPFATVSSDPMIGVRLSLSPTRQDVGTWNVTVGVTNGVIRDETSIRVEVLRDGVNHPPAAVAGGPFDGIVGRPIAFDASRSTDPDGDPLVFLWNFGDGSAQASGSSVTHAYAAEGKFAVQLTVRDASFYSQATTTARINGFAAARAYFAGGPGAALAAGVGQDVCVRIEPFGKSFSCADLASGTGSSFTLSAGAAGGVTASGFDPSPGMDGDGNGIADRGLIFTAADLGSVLAHATRGVMELTVQGDLAGGGRFIALLPVPVLRRGGPLFAGISPNPMNPTGALSFVTTRAERVDLRIFDISGRLARRAIDGVVMPAGYHQITVDGHGDLGQALPSGIYYYRIETSEGVAKGRFAIVR